MSHFEQLPEFEKEFSRLSRKYPSLPEDLQKLTRLIAISPVGSGSNFVTVHHSPEAKVVKTRLACKSLRDRSMGVIYAYRDDTVTFVYIEIYFKGDKENEDVERWRSFLKALKAGN